MDQRQLLLDSVSALAGAPVRRTARPGEKIERPEKHRKSRPIPSFIRALMLGMILKYQRFNYQVFLVLDLLL